MLRTIEIMLVIFAMTISAQTLASSGSKRPPSMAPMTFSTQTLASSGSKRPPAMYLLPACSANS
jgi:hypothetical protein